MLDVKYKYTPLNIKELLIEMKDTSELMIDLAYSAMIYDNEEIAEEVVHLEENMEMLDYHIKMVTMLSARRIEDAEQLLGVLEDLSKYYESEMGYTGNVLEQGNKYLGTQDEKRANDSAYDKDYSLTLTKISSVYKSTPVTKIKSSPHPVKKSDEPANIHNINKTLNIFFIRSLYFKIFKIYY